jgi:hypothetical protein
MIDTPKSIVVLARMAMVGTLFFVFVMYVAFVFIQPELNPIYRFGSEYSAGRMGWLMKLAFFVWGVGLLALALAMAKGLDTAARSTSAIILFVAGGVGVVFAGLFDSDLQVLNENPPPVWVEPPASDEQVLHDAGGMIGLLSQMVGAGFVTRRLRLAGRLGPKYHILRLLSWLTPVAFVAFAFFFVSYGLAGLGQRVFLALMFAWQIIAQYGLATGAFSPRDRGVRSSN